MLPDGMVLQGGALRGGEVDAFGDHRIAMAFALAGTRCREPVVIRGAEAVNKSYPAFFEDFRRLGGRVDVF
jgi:3-phosphoshikimate 1-carboxyvinyltransferase